MKCHKFLLLAVLCAAAAKAQLTYTPYSITTLAGAAGESGSANGTGSAAQFAMPYGTAVDGAGNVYVADGNNHAVRMITPAGAVTTLSTGVTGGSSFGVLGGIALDGNGFLYVTDNTKGALYKVATPSGTTSVLVPAGTFSGPWGVAVDPAGNCYVADAGNAVIQKVTPSGAASVLAGSLQNSGIVEGTGTAAQFAYPVGVAVDPTHTFLYVTDESAELIRTVTISGGVVAACAGQVAAPGSVDGALATAAFSHPTGIAVDASGNIYLTDNGLLVRKITVGSSPTVSTLAGTTHGGSADGTGSTALFSLASPPAPSGLAVDSSGSIYVADTDNDLIRKGSASTAVPPSITTQPESQTIAQGATATLSVVVSGTGPFTYQWNSGGAAISQATSATYTINDFQANNAGPYQVEVSGPGGQVFSDTATLSLGAGISGDTSLNSGGATALTAPAGGTAYQWSFNGVPISGATSATLSLTNVSTTQAGSYAVAVTSGGSTTDYSITLNVANSGRLVDLSILSDIQNSLSVGFVSGPGTIVGAQNLLIRATGPALAAFGVQGTMPNPTLTVIQRNGGATVAQNSGWGENAAAVEAADTNTGAFPLTDTTSGDSALVADLPDAGMTAGNSGYQAVVAPAASTASGTALAEVYDDTPAGTYVAGATPRLVNLSCLAVVASGSGNSVTFGFAIGPAGGSETVLIRAIGPTLGQAPFNLSGTMPDPLLVVAPLGQASNVLAQNAGWGGNGQVTEADTLAATFNPASASSKDSAVVLTLPAGAYTAQVTSPSGTGGQILVEVYEVP